MSLTKKLLFALTVLIPLALFSKLSFFESAELRAGDILKKGHQPAPAIVILAIDNKSLGEIGRWPWPRQIEAQIIYKLAEYKPRALGVDISLFEAQDQSNDLALASSLAGVDFPVALSSQAVFIRGSDEPESFLEPLEIFTSNPLVRPGHVNVSISPDGSARKLPREISGNLPFSWQIAQVANAGLPKSEDEYNINFAGPAGTFPTYSISDVLPGRIPAEALENKIILIGATAGDLHDLVSAPVEGGLLSGIEWHANAIDNILFERYVRPVGKNLVLVIFLVLSLALLIIFSRISRSQFIVLSVVYLFSLPLAGFILWGFKIELPYLSGVVLGVGAIGYEGFFRWYKAEAEKRKLRQAVQNYFSPHVLEAILANPALLNLTGEKKEVSILFSDIRSFTTISEQLEPEVLTEMLHEYFTEMAEEILATDGVLDKFIGDAIMAFWGAPLEQPDHAERAVRAAQGMIKRLGIMMERRRAAGLPVFDIGIGINTGPAIVGNMGSEKRFDYTVIGDVVNVASRLEGLNKEFKTHIIISETVKNKLSPDIKTRDLGEASVKGKVGAVSIFEVT